MTDEPTMTDAPSITKSILLVMQEIKRLEKLHENAHGNYHFASVDDFKDEVRPLMVKHGLIVHVSEESYELVIVKNAKGNDSNCAKIKFRFSLRHVNGETAEPSYLTVMLPYTGAQTSGAAQSYAIKEGLFKGTFLASSGDVTEEADLHDQNQYGTGEKLSKADARPIYESLQKEMKAVVTEDRDSKAIANWWSANREQLNMLPNDWHVLIKDQYAREYKMLKANEQLDMRSQPQ